MSRFQSTRPIRGATRPAYRAYRDIEHFNPRAPYGARHAAGASNREFIFNFNPRAPYGARLFIQRLPLDGVISIHAPHTGRDLTRRTARWWPALHFNPRAPYGARRSHRPKRCPEVRISIHAPHTGRDYKPKTLFSVLKIFQSTRPIRGATPCGGSSSLISELFQSTRPIRGATWAGQ